MAPLLQSCSFTKVLLVLCLVLVLFTSSFISIQCEVQSQNNGARRRRKMLELANEPIKKKSNSTSLSTYKNQTKLVKPVTSSSKNHTKLTKTISSSGFSSIKNQNKLAKAELALSDSASFTTKNKTKLIKPNSDSSSTFTKLDNFSFKPQIKKLNSNSSKSSNSNKTSSNSSSTTTLKFQIKKLNSTSSKSSNSTKTSTSTTKKSSDLTKISSSPKDKTTKSTKPQLGKDLSSESKSKTPVKNQSTDKKSKIQESVHKNSQPYWLDDDDDEDDIISGFRDLPSKFQETLLPDLERISKTSKAYLNRANKEITKNFKPFVGNKYAASIASIISFAFILIPLVLVSLIFNRIKAYFSLQKILIFIQIYLSIYFTILSLSTMVTGFEPLKFFYAASQSTYICVQVLQTLGYVLYLLMLLMYLILVFSTETGPTTKLIGLGQIFVGFAVGLHYYVTVFHKAVLRQQPKTSWRVHAIYATCFFVIGLLNGVDRRKKAYLEEGGEEGKKN